MAAPAQPAVHRDARRFRWRLPATGRGLLLLTLGLTIALVAVEKVEHKLRWLGGKGARWIWAPEAEPGGAATVFFAIRDFELRKAPREARLVALADEEMQLYLNGTLVGLRRYHEGDHPGVWEVAPLLRAGPNRLAAELRSGRGIGGFRASLEVDGERVAATGDKWRIARRQGDDLLEPGGEAGEETASAWVPNVGRWARTPERQVTPLFEALLTGAAPSLPEKLQVGGTAAVWRPARRHDRQGPPLGRWVAFDWGAAASGHLNVSFADPGAVRALVWYGIERPDPATAPPDEYLLKLDGPRSWSSSEARRFRYAIVVATADLVGARRLEVDPAAPGARVRPPGPDPGVFGLPPLPAHPPVEDEIRGELARVAGADDG